MKTKRNLYSSRHRRILLNKMDRHIQTKCSIIRWCERRVDLELTLIMGTLKAEQTLEKIEEHFWLPVWPIYSFILNLFRWLNIWNTLKVTKPMSVNDPLDPNIWRLDLLAKQYHKFEEFSTSAFSPNSIASGMQNLNGIRKKNFIPFTCEPFRYHFIRSKRQNIQWSFEMDRSHTNVRIWKTCA